AAVHGGRPAPGVDILLEGGGGMTAVGPGEGVGLLMGARGGGGGGGGPPPLPPGRAPRAHRPVPPRGEDTTPLPESAPGFPALLEGETEKGVRLLGRARDWGETAETPRHILWASFAALWLGDATRFTALVDRAASIARARGELASLAEALGIRSAGLAIDQRF